MPRTVAMQLIGHKTESVYRRYAIVDATMLKEAAGNWTRSTRARSGGPPPNGVGRCDGSPSGARDRTARFGDA